MINKITFLVILTVLFSTILACSTQTGLPEPSAQLPADTPTQPIPATETPITEVETAIPQTEKTEIPSPDNSVPVPDSIDISLDSSNSVPDDVLEQIGMFSGIGGGGGECFPFELNQPGAIEWGEHTFYNGERVPVTDQRLVWCACGLGAGGADANLTLPDGEIQPLEVEDSPNSEPGNRCVGMDYFFGPGSLVGPYKITLTNAGQQISDKFTLFIPQEPTGAWMDDGAWMDGGAWFVGFDPGEEIRILAFGNDVTHPDMGGETRWVFLSEVWGKADQNGMVFVRFEESLDHPMLYVTATGKDGKQTFASTIPFYGFEISEMFSMVCETALPPRLRLGNTAVVTQDGILLSDDPVQDFAEILDELYTGTQVEVIDGPMCIWSLPEQAEWRWKIITPDGLRGWLTESDSGTYYLEP
jgi:hypothetical protein